MVANAVNDQSASLNEDIAEAIIEHTSETYQSVLRKSFRVPQDDTLPLQVVINSLEYEVVDSSETGLKLLLRDDVQFRVNQILEMIELRFMEQNVPASGKVMHVSQADAKETTFGVKLDFSEAKAFHAFKEYHALIRERLFRGQHELSA